MQTDERGANITNAEPVVKIKQALTKMKNDITQMELRIGVVNGGVTLCHVALIASQLQHTLLSAKVRSKSSMIEAMHADVTISNGSF